MIVISFWTFDLLNKYKTYGDKLIVGVSCDALNFEKKTKITSVQWNKQNENNWKLKMCLLSVFRRKPWIETWIYKKYNADIFIIGDDWKGKFDDICTVIYLDRTKDISTSSIISDIKTYL